MNTAGIREDIDRIFFPYMAVNSETNTEGEKEAEAFLMRTIRSFIYFRQNRENCGAFPIPGDPQERSVCWGLVKGKGEKTVILMHHYDVAGIEDFRAFKDFAFDPEALKGMLSQNTEELTDEAAADLASGEYLFGRGTADMKAGGAIQLALLDRYSKEEDLNGNILLIAVPDEENLSSGMRGAIILLAELKKKFGLDYAYLFNSEPHQRKSPSRGLFSEGSVGKILAFVFVQGFLAHAGKVFEGLNALGLLSEIVARTEASVRLSDTSNDEASPAPTWLYMRDRKKHYDVSMPLFASGCLSILTLTSTPDDILKKLAEISEEAFQAVIERINENYKAYCRDCGREYAELPWKADVVRFGDLFDKVKKNRSYAFLSQYDKKLRSTSEKTLNGKLTLIEASLLLTEFLCDNAEDLSPKVVIGLVPPYYPSASNAKLADKNSYPELAAVLSEYTMEKYGQEYDREFHFTGISDCSYCSLQGGAKIEEALHHSMPLYGKAYSIPVAEIEELSMPCMNIGPWGKDFHKLTERVYIPDVYERTPAILAKAIDTVLE